ncbi:MAG: TetR/AcrR family transcriptional regulator [Aquabacterium sp.]
MSAATSAPVRTKSPATDVAARPSFRERVHQAREDAIVASVNRLLAEKGFDLMTVDEVAADVGIAKASLYKHFPSKEALAAAAMVQVMDQALAQVDAQRAQAGMPALDQLRAMTRWALQTLLSGRMPLLPAENSRLRATLLAHHGYLDRLMRLSDLLGEWILAAQAAGTLNPALPPEAVLYNLFSRACDPVPGFLKATGQYSDERIVEIVLSASFDGLAVR